MNTILIPRKTRILPSRFRGNLLAFLLAGFLGHNLPADSGAAPVAPTRVITLEQGFVHPPREARVRAYWWWLNGNVTRASITRDLEEMAAKGFGGALICDADGSSQDGNERTPHGPTFFTPTWRELYQHALREAQRLGLEMSLNIQSGWNLGGPSVLASEAPKKLVWTETRVSGPRRLEAVLETPKGRDGYYQDLWVLAYPAKKTAAGSVRPMLDHYAEKALVKPLNFSAPSTALLLQDTPGAPGEEDTPAKDVRDITGCMNKKGVLSWTAPSGDWVVLRFGCTLNDHCRVSTCSEGWEGYAVDPFDRTAFQRYWQAVVEPLIHDAGPLAGTTLKYLHTDSWEVEVANWTPTLREEFRHRRGYDLFPYLPVIAGKLVGSRQVSDRFLNDLRRTMGDLAIANHYQPFRENAHRHHLLIHPESGGPHAVPIDSLQCLGYNDAPMSEFWARSWRHRVGDSNRFFVKQPASAAHTYGHQRVFAEGFTTIGPHWQETLWDNLKPSFDQAACEGLNGLFWHAFTCSPEEMGEPGQEYFAGTHFNPHSTWWSKSAAFLAYLNRCQFLLQQGRFVADALYYYGDHVPNFTQLKSSDPPRILPGYDYDVATEEVLLQRLSVREGKLQLPDGMNYRLLVLPEYPNLSLPVLRKLKKLVASGATLLGAKPAYASSLRDYPRCDAELTEIATQFWGDSSGQTAGVRRFGQGRVIWGKTARQVLADDGVPPDFSYTSKDSNVQLDYLHRRVEGTEVYFVCNKTNRAASVQATFRVRGLAPELWDPLTGQVRSLPVFSSSAAGTVIPLEFTPYGSWFIVFRSATTERPSNALSNFPRFTDLRELTGTWTVQFDPAWGGPGKIEFTRLDNWIQRPEEGIRHYSGAAVYRQSFELGDDSMRTRSNSHLYLDLGDVRQLAEVRLNGQNLGVLWTMPFRVDITEAVRPGENRLEVEVVNFWPNRIIGDQKLPPEQRRTRTNIRKLTANTPLMDSGLLGPVKLLQTRENP